MNIMNLLETLAKNESGQDLIEYALVAALIGLGAVASMQGVATALTGLIANIASTVTASA